MVKITFRIHYNTNWGDQMFISGSIPEFGSNDNSKLLAMHWEGDGFWRVSIEVSSGISFTYKYQLHPHNNEIVSEFGSRLLHVDAEKKEMLVQDTWLYITNVHHPFFSSAFTRSVFKRQLNQSNAIIKGTYNVRLVIRAPRIASTVLLCVSGNTTELGNWDPEKPLLLSTTNFPNWCCNFKTTSHTIEYKYGLFDPHKKTIIQWEEGENRRIEVSTHHDITVQNDEVLRIYNEWRGAGVAIPVFSIRSEVSMGCGEFNDLKTLSDWAVKTVLKLIQILPINDTISTYTWKDSYPYNAISVNALHPIYLHIPLLFKKKNKQTVHDVQRKSTELNAFDHVNFEEVLKAKLSFARKAFMQSNQLFKLETEYISFFDKNKKWLIPYAIYSAFRDRYQTSDFRQWDEFAEYNESKLLQLLKNDSELAHEVDFYCFMQYHLDQQLSEVVAYARNLGLIVKGDIPIGINRNGVEAWQEPHLFNFSQQAGAPPDDFAVNGQNWGFPTYNWKVMEQEGYRWWQERFKKMADYFDAYRIDHILGFFRIWEIPMEYSEGLMGHFSPALPVNENELRSYGVDFSYDRFCKPYISYDHIHEQFGKKASLIIETFFFEEHGRLHFKDEFNTEAKLLKYFEGLKKNDPLKKFKDDLRFYLYEVLLVPDETSGYFHPRISLHFSRSYQHLPAEQQRALSNLYTMFFYHRHNDFWGYEGSKKLAHLVDATDMLVCGEDLGMVPHCVEGVMSALQILSLEVQRMPKDDKMKFGNPYQYPYLSVCTPATHDMATIRGWWEEDRNNSQRFYNEFMQKGGAAPVFCEAWLNEEIVEHQLKARSMLTVLSMQDWLNCDPSTRHQADPEEERINIPKNPNHYWKYRMQISLENLMQNESVTNRIKSLLQQSYRY